MIIVMQTGGGGTGNAILQNAHGIFNTENMRAVGEFRGFNLVAHKFIFSALDFTCSVRDF